MSLVVFNIIIIIYLPLGSHLLEGFEDALAHFVHINLPFVYSSP